MNVDAAESEPIRTTYPDDSKGVALLNDDAAYDAGCRVGA